MKSLVLALLLPLLAAPAQDAELRRANHPWYRWQNNTWVEKAITSRQGAVLHTHDTLLGVGDSSYRVRQKSRYEIPGTGGPGEEHTIEGQFDYAVNGYAHAMPNAVQVGTATLVAARRQFECTVWRASWKDKGRTAEETTWISPAFDHPIQTKTRAKGVELEMHLVATHERLEVGGRTVTCAVYSGKGRVDGESFTFRQWRSLEIPGGIARMVTTHSDESQHVIEVTGWRGTVRARRVR